MNRSPGQDTRRQFVQPAYPGERLRGRGYPAGVAADQAEDVRAHLDRAVEAQADLIVSSAGSAQGRSIYQVVVEEQGELDLASRHAPGKSLAFGHYQGIPFFGLPGNPVPAFLAFQLFVQPAMKKLNGMTAGKEVARRRVWASRSNQMDASPTACRCGRRKWETVARPASHQASGNVFSLVQANAILICPRGKVAACGLGSGDMAKHMTPPKLTHLDDSGRARMVDVGGKPDTDRMAVPKARVLMKETTLNLIQAGALKKVMS